MIQTALPRKELEVGGGGGRWGVRCDGRKNPICSMKSSFPFETFMLSCNLWHMFGESVFFFLNVTF